MNEQSGYATFCLYEALKLHMNDPKYDFFKYHGKIRITQDSFMKRKDKYSFYKLSRKIPVSDQRDFILANLLIKPKLWINDLLTDEAQEVYTAWLKRTQSLSYVFENDLSKLIMKCEMSSMALDGLLTVNDDNNPVLLTECYQGSIALETVMILNDLMNFFPMWVRKIEDDLFFPAFRMKCEKYAPFIQYDKNRIKTMLVQKVKESF